MVLLLRGGLVRIVGSEGMHQRPTIIAKSLPVQWTLLHLLRIACGNTLQVHKRTHLPELLVGILLADNLRTIFVVTGCSLPPKDVLELFILCFHHNYSLRSASKGNHKSPLSDFACERRYFSSCSAWLPFTMKMTATSRTTVNYTLYLTH